MKYASASLISFLNGLSPKSQPLIADLLTIRLLDGTVVRLTAAAVPVKSTSLEGATLNIPSPVLDNTVYTFLPGSTIGTLRPTFSCGAVSTKIGLAAADLELVLMVPPGATIEGSTTWQQAVGLELFDGAAITLERAFMPAWGVTSAGTLIRFKGFAGDVRSTRSTIDVTVKPGIAILDNPMPRRKWQPSCTHVLYDTGCTLVKASVTDTGTAAAGATVSVIPTSLTKADHWYELGAITFSSGANTGITRNVTRYASASGQVTVVPPLPFAPINGDAFSIYPGCDKTQATCTVKFNNLAHFAGAPFVPVPETAF